MPLTAKGHKIMANMEREYGSEKAKRVFYASANKGTITGVHGRAMGGVAPGMAARMPLRPPMPGLGAAGNAMPIGVAAPGNVMGGPLRRADGGLSAMTGAMKMGQLNSMDRFEMRGGGMMHGPLLRASPGRADKHLTQVPSGAYVLPAAHVASMGQGNSVAGLAAANSLFGSGGPYGAGTMKMGHGPKPMMPKMGMGKTFARGGYSEGGARGSDFHTFEPVKVALSGGEFVIHPNIVRAIGNGSLKNGHKILDAYVMAARKKEIKTQQNLPPPAKR